MLTLSLGDQFTIFVTDSPSFPGIVLGISIWIVVIRGAVFTHISWTKALSRILEKKIYKYLTPNLAKTTELRKKSTTT